MFFLLTLSSFGNVQCVEPGNETSSAPVVFQLSGLLSGLMSHDADTCSDDFCPCDCDSEECPNDIVIQPSHIHSDVHAPAEPHFTLLESDGLYTAVASFQQISSSPHSYLRRSTWVVYLGRMHGRSPDLSSIVLRI